jgi:hypothetical protein
VLAKTTISRIPSQKGGVEYPTIDTAPMTWSAGVLRRRHAVVPRTTPPAAASTMLGAINKRVFGMLRARIAETASRLTCE